MKHKISQHKPTGSNSIRSNDRIKEVLTNISALCSEGKRKETFELLLPLLRQFPRDVSVLKTAVDVYDSFGLPWNKIYYLRQLAEVDPNLLLWLAQSYEELQLSVLSLQTLRRIEKMIRDPQELEKIRMLISVAENEIQPVVHTFAKNRQTAELGLKLMEEAQIALHLSNNKDCIELNLRASRELPNFPPPLNNLSLAYFFSGQWKHAIQITRGVLKNHPNNLQAQANLIHFLAWTGGLPEAQEIWKQIRILAPTNENTFRKFVETAAIMEDDETIFKLLRPHDYETLDEQSRFYLAVAEANLGKSSARKKFRALANQGYPGAQEILIAIRNGKKGRGFYERFSYKISSEYLPAELHNLLNESKKNETLDSLSNKLKQQASRYPQLILAAKKLIYEEDMSEAGCQLLVDIASPESYTVLREFGMGQVGDKQARIHALNLLLDAGQLPNGSRMQIWDDDKWTEVELRRIMVSDEDDRPYSMPVKKILDQGLRLYKQGKQAEAEEKFLQALKMEPRAKEALNNLGTIYFQAGQTEHGLEMFRQAVEIDPLYIMARCNIAIHLITEGRIEAAQEMLIPLGSIEKASSQGMSFLSYTRARLAYIKEEYEEAENQAEMALRFNPDNKHAQELRDNANLAKTLKSFTDSPFFARSEEFRARARQKLQRRISNPAPAIAEVLAIFSREILQTITRKWAPYSGWSTFKKAELLKYLEGIMLDPDHVDRMLTALQTDEKVALQNILSMGGTISWEEFSHTYDNDLDESPYWQYHDPETLMGRLRSQGLIVEVTVDEQLLLAIPLEFRAEMKKKF